MANDQTYFFTGYAKLPSGTTAGEINKVVGIGLEVEGGTGRIVDADCTLVTDVGRRFFRNLVLGYSLDTELSIMVAAIERRYHGNAQKALVSALKITQEKYRAFKQKGIAAAHEPSAEDKR